MRWPFHKPFDAHVQLSAEARRRVYRHAITIFNSPESLERHLASHGIAFGLSILAASLTLWMYSWVLILAVAILAWGPAYYVVRYFLLWPDVRRAMTDMGLDEVCYDCGYRLTPIPEDVIRCPECGAVRYIPIGKRAQRSAEANEQLRRIRSQKQEPNDDQTPLDT